MEVLALITARGGSKGIPRKNIIPFLGKPLINWSIYDASHAESVSRVVVTTDDSEIANVARAAGAEVPFLRPPELADDDTLDLPVFQHALTWLKNNEQYSPDLVIHLRPTTPLRSVGLIEAGVDLLANDRDADSVRAVCLPANNPYKMWRLKNGEISPLIQSEIPEAYNQPRQKLPVSYWQTGTLDITRPSTIFEKNSMTGDKILPLIIDRGLAIDIDDELSLEQAERVMQRYMASQNELLPS
jgi:CMP-N,N'-diacetyllegionaminic acid synthase